MTRIRSIPLAEVPGTHTATLRYLYVIGEVGTDRPVKVGRAAHPVWRMQELQSGNYRRLELRGIWTGPRDTVGLLERYLHRALSDMHVGGEWFDCAASLVAGLVDEAVQ